MSHTGALCEVDLAIRHHVYQFFAEHARPPTPVETGAEFRLSEGQATANSPFR